MRGLAMVPGLSLHLSAIVCKDGAVDPPSPAGPSALGANLFDSLGTSVARAARNEYTILFLVAIAIGSVAAFGAILFVEAVDAVHLLGFGVRANEFLAGAESQPPWRVILVPALGGLAIGVFLHVAIDGGRVHGVAQAVAASAIGRGRIHTSDALVSAIGSAVSLGVGASTGREGPVVHLGAWLGAWVAKRLNLGQSLSRTLLGCGAAASIGALFNAPIAGVFFALEVIIGGHALRSFAPVVVSAVTGTLIGRTYFGDALVFDVTAGRIHSLWEFPAFALLGVACAAAAIVFMHAIFAAGRIADRTRLPRWLRPAVGGLAVGVIALWLPQVLGVGYEATDAALDAKYGLALLLVLIVAKVVATAVSLGFGFGGGVFGPSLVLGAFVGGAFGIVAGAVFPGAYSGTAAYALIGTGAVAGAVLGAPLSTILIIFELTGDYEMTIAVMVATVIAAQLTQLLYGHSYFHKQLALAGINLGRGQELQILGSITVESVMQTRLVTAPADTDLADLAELIAAAPNSEVYIVDRDGALCGIATMSEVSQRRGGPGTAPAGDIARPCPTVVALADHVADVVATMQSEEETRLPVVDDRTGRKLVGLIREADLLRAVNRVLLDAQRAAVGGPVHGD